MENFQITQNDGAHLKRATLVSRVLYSLAPFVIRFQLGLFWVWYVRAAGLQGLLSCDGGIEDE